MDEHTQLEKYEMFKKFKNLEVVAAAETKHWPPVLPGLGFDGVGILAATPATGKTFLALDIAMSVAAGEPIAGGAWAASKGPSPAIAILAEEDDYTVANRYRAILHHRPELKRGIKLLCLPELSGGSLDVFDLGVRRRLREMVKAPRLPCLDSKSEAAQGPARLLVLDTLCCFHSADENNNALMSQFILVLRGIVKGTGCAVLLCHHMKKGAKSELDSMRGASALNCGARAVYFLADDPQDGDFGVQFSIRKAGNLPRSELRRVWCFRRQQHDIHGGPLLFTRQTTTEVPASKGGDLVAIADEYGWTQ